MIKYLLHSSLKGIVWVGCIFVLLAGCTENDKTEEQINRNQAQVTSKENKDDVEQVQLVVDARLVDTGLPAPKPGTIYMLSLMRYEVIDVISGDYKDSLIYVAHHVPDLMSSDFTLGSSHRLRLTAEFPRQASILDKYQTEISQAAPKFCLSFEKVE